MFAQSGIRSGIVFYDARVHIIPDLYTHPTHNTPTLAGNGAQFFWAGAKTGVKTGTKTATTISAKATNAAKATKARIFGAAHTTEASNVGAKTGTKTATAISAKATNATNAANAAKARIFGAYIVYNHKSQRDELQQTGNNLR